MSTIDTVKLTVVSAGLSSPSTTRLLADQLAGAARKALSEQGQTVQVKVVELRNLAHDLADALLTGFAPDALAAAQADVVQADALVAVTPVFSASYSGLFKTFFDVLEKEALVGKPIMMGATAGTARHSLVLEHALRPLFSYLKATPVPTAVFAASEDFGPAADGSVSARADRAGRELASLLGGVAPRTERRERSVDDQFAAPTPFAEMLARVGQ